MGKQKKPRTEVKLICNPEAGEPRDPSGRVAEATRLLMSLGLQVDPALAHPKERATDIARRALADGYRTVIVMGGDGTIEAVLPALAKTKARLGIIHAGTENNVSRSLGIPADLEGACRMIADGIQRNLYRKIDIGQIQVGDGKKMVFFELAAVGLISTIFPEAQELYKGQWRAVGEAITEFIHYRAPKMKLILDDDRRLKEISPLVTVSNTPSFGADYLLAPDASMEDGLLDVNFYPQTSKAGILAYFEEVSHGRNASEPNIERYRVRKIKISTQPKQEVMADGILLGKGKVKIKVLKGALRVITGSPAALAPQEPAQDQQLPEPAAPDPSTESNK